MDNTLFYINVSLDVDKTRAFVDEKTRDGFLTADTILSVDMFDWDAKVGNDEISVFPTQLKIG